MHLDLSGISRRILRMFSDPFLHGFEFYRRWVGGAWYLVIPLNDNWVVWVTDPYKNEKIVEVELYE